MHEAASARLAVDLAAYRAAVASLVEELVRTHGASVSDPSERITAEWLTPAELRRLLQLLPGGTDLVARTLAQELRRYRRHAHRSASAHSPADLVRIYLLSQIDTLWWDTSPQFETDDDIRQSPELIEVHQLRRSGLPRFNYHRLPRGLPGRSRDWVWRRIAPHRRPHTAGLRLTGVRPEMLAMLNELALAFKRATPPGTPNIWVTSMVRSVQEQDQLRALGYPAFLPSAHCSGYAFDVEVEWFRRFGARDVLTGLLLERERAGSISTIDEGQVWHVCMSPDSIPGAEAGNTALRRS